MGGVESVLFSWAESPESSKTDQMGPHAKNSRMAVTSPKSVMFSSKGWHVLEREFLACGPIWSVLDDSRLSAQLESTIFTLMMTDQTFNQHMTDTFTKRVL